VGSTVWCKRERDKLFVDDEHRITGAEAPDQAPRVAQAAVDDGAGRRAGASRPSCQFFNTLINLIHPRPIATSWAAKSSIIKGATIMERREVPKTKS
jgi:hypothetical protein